MASDGEQKAVLMMPLENKGVNKKSVESYIYGNIFLSLQKICRTSDFEE